MFSFFEVFCLILKVSLLRYNLYLVTCIPFQYTVRWLFMTNVVMKPSSRPIHRTFPPPTNPPLRPELWGGFIYSKTHRNDTLLSLCCEQCPYLVTGFFFPSGISFPVSSCETSFLISLQALREPDLHDSFTVAAPMPGTALGSQ